MDRKFSILILSWRGTRLRRFVFSKRSLRCLLAGTVILLGFSGWLFGDYLWMKFQRKKVKQIRVEAKAHRQQLSTLQERTKDIQHLLADWKGLQEKVQASLPTQRQSSANGHLKMKELEKSLVSLQSELERLIASTPSGRPLKGQVSSGVGTRISPWTGKPEFHSGLDIPNPTGAPVYAPGDGVVDLVGESNGKGLTVVLNHGQGITTQYAHLSKSNVKKGDRVRKGQEIANVGNTGKSTSPHLHYEVRVNGVPIDPRRYLME
ncbi:MAG: peptidoglycan DD-metalloendopeptidase family protein [Candidatus Binatia bacterium]